MTIPESQLDTWAKQGSVTQSQSTYATVRNCLSSSDAPYSGKNYNIFLQGSYGNDTNIYADSDVDVVIQTDSIYYYDDSELSDDDKRLFHSGTGSGSYSYSDFKKDVNAQLVSCFGNSVKPGKKAILVEGSGSRRDTDVLPAVEHRRYFRYKSMADQSYAKGICFWTANGTKIINYPKQHSENCTSKHQATTSWFKPTVRIIKNMRNSMIENGYIEDGLAPSYFLEGMIYNVPNGNFGHSYQATMIAVLNWLHGCNREELLCANEQYYLLREGSPVTWRLDKFETFLAAAIRFWNDW